MKLVAKTMFGLENVLSKELKSLGAENIELLNRAVSFEGNTELLYKANYCCRTALSILQPVTSFRIYKARDIYYRSLKINWEDYLDIEQTFAISTVAHSKLFNHTTYAGLVLKDAIADHFFNRYKKRPSVDQTRPDILINLHVSENDVTISIDSSGLPLYKRGYRISQSVAPINEVLAAGMILISGWDFKTSFLDPMCGSGTIPIEAALIALKIPPGKYRKSFGFMNWKSFKPELFRKIKEEADAEIVSNDLMIYCSDNNQDAISSSTMNISSAGMNAHIKLMTKDFFASGSGGQEFLIVTNPPYGERLKQDDIDQFYSKIGERLKHGYESSVAWLITSNLKALKFIGLKPSRKEILYNGSLECRYVRYDLYRGSLKK